MVLINIWISYTFTKGFFDSLAQHQILINQIETFTNYLSSLKDAETGERGFIITGDESYLEPYDKGIQFINSEQLKEVLNKYMNGSDPILSSQVKKLMQLVNLRLEQFAQIIEIRKTRGVEKASEKVIQNYGKAIMDQIRDLMNSITERKEEELKKFDEIIPRLMQKSVAYLILVNLIGISLISLCLFSVYKSTKKLEMKDKELLEKQKALNEDLRAATYIQQSLLPLPTLHLPKLDIFWVCQPSEAVGGDICSIHKADEENSVFYILDVSGHGLPSAMVTLSITQFLQLQLNTVSSKQALERLNWSFPF